MQLCLLPQSISQVSICLPGSVVMCFRLDASLCKQASDFPVCALLGATDVGDHVATCSLSLCVRSLPLPPPCFPLLFLAALTLTAAID